MIEPSERPFFLTDLGVELARVAHDEAERLRQAPRPRPRRHLRTTLVTAAIAVAAAGGAGAATGVITFEDLVPGSGETPQDAQRFARGDRSGTYDPALVRELSVLRRPRTAADAMGDAGRHVGGDVAPGSSRRVAPPAPPAGTPHASAMRLPAWLVPTGSGAVSLQLLAPGATGPTSAVSADPATLAAGRARMTLDRDLLGVAPDGVASVTVTLRDGSRVELPVAGNVYGAHFDQEIADVRLAAASAEG